MKQRIKLFFLTACFVILPSLFLLSCSKPEAFVPNKAPEIYTCLILASYHDGYAGQDDVIAGIRAELGDEMLIEQFNMDTKNNPGSEFAEAVAFEAKTYIDTHKPDIVIAMDDNASKYVVMPYFKDSAIPFVFVGVNWTVESYGYPYANVTGMIEVHPIAQAITEIKNLLPDIKTGSCIYPDTESDAKHFERFKKLMDSQGLTVVEYRVNDSNSFKKAFLEAQSSDFVMFTNNIGLSDWDESVMGAWVHDNTKKLTVSTNPWMSPYVVMTFSMDSAEQGSYVAQVAKKILLDGASPSDIPIVSNRTYNLTLNETLIEMSTIEINHDLYQKALKIER